MTRLVLLLLALTLGGCVVVPFNAYHDGYRRPDGAYGQRDRGHDYYRYDRDYRYRGDRY